MLIGINCATFRPARNWTIAGYSQLAEQLIRELSVKVAFCGRSLDYKIFNNIKMNLSVKVIDLVGRLTIRQLTAFIKRCNLFISPDSGPMHIAAALRVPLVSLFGEGEYNELRPFGDEQLIEIIRTPIKLIAPASVIMAVKKLLSK
jgi:ADP-heptose:LPS heptosyltransferase